MITQIQLYFTFVHIFLFSATRSVQDYEVALPSGANTSLAQDASLRQRSISVIRIPATLCPSTVAPSFDQGYCDGFLSCLSNGGKFDSFCSLGVGACCVVKKSCGKAIRGRVGYFVSPGFPSKTTTSGQCQIQIFRYQTDVSQVRLDFIRFELDGPDDSGKCVTEKMVVEGASNETTIPTICGANTGQNIQFNFPFGSSDPITIVITLDGSSESIFNLKIIQFRNDNPNIAPRGCLQYFTEPTGTIRSFNFSPTSTQHLALEMFYEICIRKNNASCPITWTATTFDVSNGGNPNECVVEMRDYVNFPRGRTTPPGAVQFINAVCDVFPDALLSPDYRVDVSFNGNENQENVAPLRGRRGFELNYVINPACA